MSQIVIYGASDDLIEIEGDVPGCDEYNEESARFLVRGAKGEQMIVSIEFMPSGCWRIGVEPADELWPMLGAVIDQDRYTARATIDGVSMVELLAGEYGPEATR